ncbi:MAG: hypothetical protein D3910_18865, partial [Candidatus Electrothrix sp. ATG2]|nr:hypothetical protein [Candidatus Electrothrix sp. ATG2]
MGNKKRTKQMVQYFARKSISLIAFFSTVQLVILSSVLSVPARADIARKDAKKSLWANRIHFSVTGRRLDFEQLDETLTISPLDRFIRSNHPWTIDWQQDMFYGSLVYDFLDAPLFTLSSGLHFGMSQGEFSAAATVT